MFLHKEIYLRFYFLANNCKQSPITYFPVNIIFLSVLQFNYQFSLRLQRNFPCCYRAVTFEATFEKLSIKWLLMNYDGFTF